MDFFSHNISILRLQCLTEIICFLYLALCKKACLNGGVCYDSNKCNCKSGWSGATCNIGKIIILIFNKWIHKCMHLGARFSQQHDRWSTAIF